MLALRTATRRGPARSGQALRLPFTAHIVLWLLLGVLMAALTAWTLWLLLGQPVLRPGPSGPASTQDKFDGLKIALTVVGGIGGVIALTVAYRKQRLGEAAERREDTKAFTDRFTKASELIGSDQAAVRLAGIYAMAALADDWDDHRQTCIDVLCAYLRMPYDPPATTPPPLPQGNRGLGLRKPTPRRNSTSPAPTPSAATPEDPREEQQVRRTVIRVIAVHLRPDALVSWNGRTFDFTGATLDGGDLHRIDVVPDTEIIFRNATFSGHSFNFEHTKFSGGTVDFSGATFSGGQVYFGDAMFSAGAIDFRDAKFYGGQVYFGDATFSGSRVSFEHAKFSGGNVDFGSAIFSDGMVDFVNATFSGGIVDFGDVSFSGSWISFARAKFSGSSVDFRFATFSGSPIDFAFAAFSGGRFEFKHATFSGSMVNFGFATFSGTRLDFEHAKFSGGMAYFGDVTFSGGMVDISDAAILDLPPHFGQLSEEAAKWVRLPSPM